MGAPLGNKNAEGEHKKSNKAGDLDHPDTRFAWGFNDAKAAGGKDPLWKGQHFDKSYGAGYEAGRYGGHASAADALKAKKDKKAAQKSEMRAAALRSMEPRSRY